MGDRMYRLHGYHFWAERIFEWFEHPRLQIEVFQIIIHKADQPDVFVNFFDADGLTGEDRAEVNFLAPQTDAAAVRRWSCRGRDSRCRAVRYRNGWKADRPQPDTSCSRLHE